MNRDNEDYPRYLDDLDEELERIAYEQYMERMADELI